MAESIGRHCVLTLHDKPGIHVDLCRLDAPVDVKQRLFLSFGDKLRSFEDAFYDPDSFVKENPSHLYLLNNASEAQLLDFLGQEGFKISKMKVVEVNRNGTDLILTKYILIKEE